MKNFFKMFLASVLGVITAQIIITCIFLFIFIGMVASMASKLGGGKDLPRIESKSVLHIDGSTFPEIVALSPMDILKGSDESNVSLSKAIEAIAQAKNDPNIAGIYLDMADFGQGMASAQAFRRALEDFKKSGKFITSYADTYTQKGYYLASVADQVYLNPQGMLLINGISSQTIFFKGALDKLGVDMMVFKVGTFKGAVEPYVLDKLSPENRMQIDTYITGLWDTMTTDMAASRKISVDSIKLFAERGDFFKKQTLTVDNKLVDELLYRSDVEEKLKAKLELGEKDEINFVSLEQVSMKSPTVAKSGKNQIAVLFAEGEITDARINVPSYKGNAITGKLAEDIRKLAKDDNVKAVVLRVNSPGGSAYTSEQIWKEVINLKAKKPIVISMGDLAASGGYYISCAANAIVAEPTTLTGSIGIFGMFPNLANVKKRLGVSTDVVSTSKFAGFGNQLEPMTADDKALLQSYIEMGYDTFLTRVSDGRGMSKAAVDSVAQGRVWLGNKAFELGLVDELGGLDTAIERAAVLASLGSDFYVNYATTKRDFLSELLGMTGQQIKASISKQFLTNDEFLLIENMRKAREVEGIQARLPLGFMPY